MIPVAFLQRMRTLLGDDYESFYNALMDEKNVHAVRHNPNKIEKESFLSAMAEDITPLSYTNDGYLCQKEKIGHHPLHHAGAIYSQDPGAMAPLNCLAIEKGWFVADFCAAPGGKTTQLAAMVGDSGFVLSNEVNLPRCKTLAGNVERLGVRNTVVTNVSTDVLSSWFSACFDLVVVDAPCSGEGMFRKYAIAGQEWDPTLIPMCAERQAEILSNAAKTVKCGGYLLYSTCTFSIEENEANIDFFLEKHPEFSVCDVQAEVKAVTADGIVFDGAKHPESLKKARRFYPHLQPGEGQFMCLLQKERGEEEARFLYSSATRAASKEEQNVVHNFLKEVLNAPLDEILPGFIVAKQGDFLSLVSNTVPLPPNRVYLAGVTIGTVQKGRVTPHHHLFSALGKHFRIKLDLSLDSRELSAYLHGDTVPAPNLPNGYGVVTVLGAPIGGIKVVDGVAKNHYPKGLRNL
ncbi:MAG: hypothetical protein E7609_00895 [Ruminococcaceae bacterium]|nr:hypothetical protein [Oscillospiraceae bacterium]